MFGVPLLLYDIYQLEASYSNIELCKNGQSFIRSVKLALEKMLSQTNFLDYLFLDYLILELLYMYLKKSCDCKFSCAFLLFRCPADRVWEGDL